MQRDRSRRARRLRARAGRPRHAVAARRRRRSRAPLADRALRARRLTAAASVDPTSTERQPDGKRSHRIIGYGRRFVDDGDVSPPFEGETPLLVTNQTTVDYWFGPLHLASGVGQTLTVDDTTETSLYLLNDSVADALNNLYAAGKITVSSAASPFPRPTAYRSQEQIPFIRLARPQRKRFGGLTLQERRVRSQ